MWGALQPNAGVLLAYGTPSRHLAQREAPEATLHQQEAPCTYGRRLCGSLLLPVSKVGASGRKLAILMHIHLGGANGTSVSNTSALRCLSKMGSFVSPMAKGTLLFSSIGDGNSHKPWSSIGQGHCTKPLLPTSKRQYLRSHKETA